MNKITNVSYVVNSTNLTGTIFQLKGYDEFYMITRDSQEEYRTVSLNGGISSSTFCFNEIMDQFNKGLWVKVSRLTISR